jgi:hypothetical protein
MNEDVPSPEDRALLNPLKQIPLQQPLAVLLPGALFRANQQLPGTLPLEKFLMAFQSLVVYGFPLVHFLILSRVVS